MSGGPARSPSCARCGAELGDTAARFCPECGAPVVTPPHEDDDPLLGQTLLGRYRVEKLLGQGGMGRVYLAEQRLGHATRKVAIKILSPKVAGDPTVVTRLHREAAAILELSSPHTVRLYESAEDAGRLLLVLEYVPGQRLAEVLDRGRVPPARALVIAAQIGASLEEAHRRGIVHRDLKPENVILSGEPGGALVVKVLDFGVAKHVAHAGGDAITVQGTLIGTPAYMSPEQFSSEGVDARSDVYALGLLTYQMLAGELPWSGKNVYEWASRHVRTPAPPLADRVPGLPARVYEAVAHALEKRREDRTPSAAQFVRELTGMSPGDNAWATLAAADSAAQLASQPTLSAAPSRPVPTVRPPGRGDWMLLGALFVLAGGLGFGAVALLSRRDARQAVPRAPVVGPSGTTPGNAAPSPARADAAVRPGPDAAGDGGAAELEHPNWLRAQRFLMEGLVHAEHGELSAALDALESAQDLIGPTSIKLTNLRAAVTELGARAVRAQLAARRCADAQAMARRLRRVGAEGEVHRRFGVGCAAP